LKKSILGWLLAGALALASSTALATFHTFIIQEIYSNASGTVQYIVLQEAQGMDGQDLFKTHGMQRTSSDGSHFLTFPFPKNLPSPSTARKFVLIGSQSFAALGLITPDYVMPDGFMLITNGVMNFAGVDEIDYVALPTDGINALYRDGSSRPNLATNFSGNTASVATTAAAANYQGLWFNPAESGWGINFAHQGDVIFASWFTYDLTGKGTWLVMTATKTGPGTYTGQLFQGTGPAFDAVPFPPLGSPGGATVSGLGGTGTITFTDANNATFAYTLAGTSQTKPITRQLLGAGSAPVCTFGAQANLALATNYTDLWWATPAGSEAGWGINLTHQGDIIFATWFTFDHDRTPRWMVVQVNKTGPGTYAGTQVYRLTGPAFNTVPFPAIGSPGGPTGVVVGTASFVFSDGNSAMFSYTVDGMTQSKAITREVFVSPGTVCQ
jgi:hypothetical protein